MYTCTSMSDATISHIYETLCVTNILVFTEWTNGNLAFSTLHMYYIYIYIWYEKSSEQNDHLITVKREMLVAYIWRVWKYHNLAKI